MPYAVVFKPSAEKELHKLPSRSRSRIVQKIAELEQNPRPNGSEKLSGHQNRHRIRIGDYRVVYEIRDEVLIVLVLGIGHRREIYRRNP